MSDDEDSKKAADSSSSSRRDDRRRDDDDRRGRDDNDGGGRDGKRRERSRSPERSSSGPILLSLSLFREGDSSKSQLAGTVFVKTAASHTAERVGRAFCRWAGLPLELCTLFDSNKNELDLKMAIGAQGLVTSSPVIVFVTKDGPAVDAKAASAPFHVVDVLDSELSSVATGLDL